MRRIKLYVILLISVLSCEITEIEFKGYDVFPLELVYGGGLIPVDTLTVINEFSNFKVFEEPASGIINMNGNTFPGYMHIADTVLNLC